VRHLQEYAGTVAGVDLATTGASVVEILQNLDRISQHLVGFAALDVDDEPEAAGVALVLGVVQALFGGPGGSGAVARNVLRCHGLSKPLEATITTGPDSIKGFYSI
jgi:hypothetical protein